MFYSIIPFFSLYDLEKIKKEISLYGSKSYQGWSERFNSVIRTDCCCLYYSDWVFSLIRHKVMSTFVHPVDWIFKPWRIHKFGPNGFYNWHTDKILLSPDTPSERTRTIIINLDKEYSCQIKTRLGVYYLTPGVGIQIPVEDYYAINIDKNERLEHNVLTTWGMRTKLFN